MEANMNLKKLDTIKTPENWKRELLEQHYKRKFKY